MGNQRQLFWDAQNRLQGISEDRALHHYVYDEEGQRALKSEGASRTLYKDGNLNTRPGPTVMGAYTYYPNGYVVANDRQVSKHYYIGSNKVAARVAETPSHLFLSPENQDLQRLAAILQQEADNIAVLAGLPSIEWANPLPGTGSVRESEEDCSMKILIQADQFFRSGNQICYQKIMKGYETAMLNGTVCAFWHQFKLDDCMTDLPPEEQRYQTYWVHPDHLGSGSVITNQSGETTNWYEYMPFGEMLMEQSNNEYNNPFKYNGKELDEATGLYYYGARYYDPKTSIWLSVDPLAEKMPSWSPYAYSFNNPINFVDPDGRMPVPPDDHFNQYGKFLYTDNKKTNNIVIDFQNPITGSLNTAPWLSTQLKDYKFDKNNMQTLMNIANHYAKEAGVDLDNLRGGSVSVAMWNNKIYSGGTADRKSGEYKTFNGGEYCYSCLLQTNKIEKIISIPVDDNSVNYLLNDKYNFVSALQHEGGATVPSHLNVNMNSYDSSTKGQSKEHYKVYDYQINKSPIFKKTTKDFQDQMNKTFRAVKNGATGNGGN